MGSLGGRKWLYFPFKDISADPTMPGNLTRYQNKYGANLTVRQFGDGNLLNDVGDDDVFIVAGHGLPGDEEIGVTAEAEVAGLFGKKVKKIQVTLTANDLAAMLDSALLPKTHKYIKTISCGGAGMAVADDANVVMDATNTTAAALPIQDVNATDCFASVLAAAMGLRNYSDILVRGYPGFVNALGTEKTVWLETGTGLGNKFKLQSGLLRDKYWKDGKAKLIEVPAKSLNETYWFNCDGRLTRKFRR